MNLNFWPESQICVGCKIGELQLNTDEPCVYKCKYKPEGGKCKYHEDGVPIYNVGDKVSSVGGFFTEGEIIGIMDDNGYPIYKIKWTRDSRQSEPIDFLQARAGRVIRPLEEQAKVTKKDDIQIELHKEGSKYRLYSIEPFGREKHLVCTWDSREMAEKAAELYFDVLYAVYEKMEDAVTKVAYDEAVKYLGASGLTMPHGDIYPEQLAEQTNDLVKLCTGLAQVAMQNAVDTEGKSVWRE